MPRPAINARDDFKPCANPASARSSAERLSRCAPGVTVSIAQVRITKKKPRYLARTRGVTVNGPRAVTDARCDLLRGARRLCGRWADGDSRALGGSPNQSARSRTSPRPLWFQRRTLRRFERYASVSRVATRDRRAADRPGMRSTVRAYLVETVSVPATNRDPHAVTAPKGSAIGRVFLGRTPEELLGALHQMPREVEGQRVAEHGRSRHDPQPIRNRPAMVRARARVPSGSRRRTRWVCA
jgi:hypothetical protein